MCVFLNVKKTVFSQFFRHTRLSQMCVPLELCEAVGSYNKFVTAQTEFYTTSRLLEIRVFFFLQRTDYFKLKRCLKHSRKFNTHSTVKVNKVQRHFKRNIYQEGAMG